MTRDVFLSKCDSAVSCRTGGLGSLRNWGLPALAAIIVVVAGNAGALAKSPPNYRLARSTAEEAIRDALQQATTVDFVEQPLSDVLQYLEDLHKIQIELDNRALEDSAASADTPINRNVRNVSLASALDLMLKDLNLDYLVANDVLLITSKEEAMEATELRIYSVKDLLSADRCTKFLAETVEAMFKDSADHQLYVTPFGDVLVVRDTQRGHGEIERLLDTLRLALAGEPQPAPKNLSAPSSQFAPENASAASKGDNSFEEPAADPFGGP